MPECRKQRFGREQTSADDGGADFDRAPVGNSDEVPGEVARLEEGIDPNGPENGYETDPAEH